MENAIRLVARLAHGLLLPSTNAVPLPAVACISTSTQLLTARSWVKVVFSMDPDMSPTVKYRRGTAGATEAEPKDGRMLQQNAVNNVKRIYERDN